MGIEKDNPSSCPEADELLPARRGDGDVASGAEALAALEAHERGCARCGDLMRARVAFANELRQLPRIPVPAESAVDFARAMQAVTGTLDAELARGEARWRPVVAALARAEMTAAAADAIRSAVVPATSASQRPRRLLRLVRNVAAFAAAAGLVAAALFTRSAAPARSGLAADTARLSGSTPIRVELVDLPTPTDATGAARVLGFNALGALGAPPPRGGGP